MQEAVNRGLNTSKFSSAFDASPEGVVSHSSSAALGNYWVIIRSGDLEIFLFVCWFQEF